MIGRMNSNTKLGIYLRHSSNNTIYHTNPINNTLYNAYDTGDGIGNDPHPIPGGTSIDHFPLTQPWSGTQQLGDLNGDDQITPTDAAIALRIATGSSASCDTATLAAVDVSDDGRVTSLDALMILQAAVGNINI